MTKILIIGGYGVFGGLLAKRLLRENIGEVLIAGRTITKAEKFCAEFGGQPVLLDRDKRANIASVFSIWKPDIVVDAAGPFDLKPDGYAVAQEAIEIGAHYLDLADNADFVASIDMLDRPAKVAGVLVISGMSSVPAISSAAIEALSKDMVSIETIDMAIMPGNRAPRGLAVIESILDQAGKPYQLRKNGNNCEQICWGDLIPRNLEIAGHEPITGRWTSSIQVPDTSLAAVHYGANTVTFRAGLELRLLHGGLWLMAWLPRLKLVKSLRPLSRLVQIIAGWFENIGSDRGGMFVEVYGKDKKQQSVFRRWTLIAEEGAGPNVPATPAYVMIKKIIAGGVTSGARPALGEIELVETEEALSAFAIYCETKTIPV